jgi:hypothetical protein
LGENLGAVSIKGLRVRAYLRDALKDVKDANGNLSTKFWLQFYGDFPSLMLGCIQGLPDPPPVVLPIRDSIVEGLQKVMAPNFAQRSVDRFALALENINDTLPLNESELYGILNASEESANVSKFHSLKMKMIILELFGRT